MRYLFGFISLVAFWCGITEQGDAQWRHLGVFAIAFLAAIIISVRDAIIEELKKK